MRIALGIEYDGTRFYGWQTQPHGTTVQDTLNQGIAKIAGLAGISTVAGGRTDAGVHAAMQVVHFDSPVRRPMTAWVRGVNALLPAEIAVLWAREVSGEFHARFSAFSRSYSYYLLTSQVRPCLLFGRIGWHHQMLDVPAMQEAAGYLRGRHDFSSFRASECQAKSPIKDLQRLEVSAKDGIIRFDLQADSFLHHMVRNIVGSLVYVGKHALRADEMAGLLAARARILAPPTFMPDGLFLTGFGYPETYDLPSKAEPPRMTLWR